MKRFSFAFIILSACLSWMNKVQAAEINFKNFETGVSSLSQNSGNSISGIIRYAPNMMVRDDVKIGLSVDFAPHKFNDETKFNAMNVLANAEYIVSSDWSFGAAVGSETWSCSGCGAKTVLAISGRKSVDFNLSAINVQSAFLQLLTIDTDPKTSGAIAGVQIQF